VLRPARGRHTPSRQALTATAYNQRRIELAALTATRRPIDMVDGDDGMAIALKRRRFTVDEYHRMGEVGILGVDDRVELIEGEIVELTPIGRRHAAAVARINHMFSARLREHAVVWIQSPLLLIRFQSEPQPDVMLLAPRPDFYAAGLPEPRDVRLLVEVADSSLVFDRRTKLPLYARSGVSEAWLVDVDARHVEVHRGAADTGYREVRVPGAAETFAPDAFPHLVVTRRDLLG
jgi:Uma2 family endonuclease